MGELPQHPLDNIEATIALSSRLQRHVLEASIADLGFNLTQAMIVRYLYFRREHGESTLNQTEIAECLTFRKPATSAAVEILASRGQVTKTSAPDDRRATLVQITEKGIDAAEQIEQRFAPVRAAIEHGVPDAQMEVFRRIVAHIYTNLELLVCGFSPGELVNETGSSLPTATVARQEV